MTDSQSVRMSWYRAHFGTCDQILLPVRKLLSESCSLLSMGCPLWWEDRSVIFSAICQWSEWQRTHNHILLSYLRLLSSLFVCFLTKSKLLYDWWSVSQYVSISSPLWKLWPDISSCRKVAVWKLQSTFYGAPSLTWEQVCSLQCSHSMVWVAQNP
jgi:hypothetical protein